MNKRPPAKKPQAKIQTVKKQIPVKKIAPDRIEELVKKHLGNIGEAENAFKSVSALLEKHKTKYPEPEQSTPGSQLRWFHSHVMWFWESSYSQTMWFENERCYRSEPFM